jgi:hypothetical protein
MRWAYDTPSGWEETGSGPMRDVGWRVAGNPDALCTFSTLTGSGGGLLENVNRWRKQMSLEPIQDSDLASLPREMMLGRQAVLVDLQGTFVGMGGTESAPDSRLLGLIAELPMASAFLKLTGPAAVVEAERKNFLALAASIRMGGAPPASTGAGPANAGPPSSSSSLSWTAPEGWERQPDRMMREVTFVPKAALHAECYIAIVQGGGDRGNVDRWRGQMGLKPMTDAEFDALPRAKVLGGNAVFCALEGAFSGMGGGPGVPGQMLLGMVVVRPSSVVTVKMTGPADEVRGQQDAFRAFCESLRD